MYSVRQFVFHQTINLTSGLCRYWYYVVGGLGLYMIDKFLRVVHSARPMEAVTIKHAAGVTQLTVPLADAFPDGMCIGAR